MQTQEVIQICSALAKAGKKPTIALVKTKLMNKVSLAAVVKGIQQFNANKELGISEASTLPPKDTKNTAISPANAALQSCTCEARVEQLENQLNILSEQLIALQTQVQALNPS
jgi:hypothetical protein